MKKICSCVVLIAAIFPAFVFAGTTLAKLAEKNQGKSLAIVSLSASNYENALGNWNSFDTRNLMGGELTNMLAYTENLFAADWKIIRASDFVSFPAFQYLAGQVLPEAALPVINGSIMPLLGRKRKHMVKAAIDKDKLLELQSLIGADFMMVIYSEWTFVTGSWVKISKPYTKNVVRIYNAKGKSVYSGRFDHQSRKVVGYKGRLNVNDESIKNWVNSYYDGIEVLFEKGRK